MAGKRDAAEWKCIEMVALTKPATTTCIMCSTLSIPVLPTFSWRCDSTLLKMFFAELFAKMIAKAVTNVHDHVFSVWQIKS